MGHEYQSPLRRWDVLAGLAKQCNAKSFVEVGCKEGRTTGFMLASVPDLNVIAIDPWEPVPNADEDYKDWDFKAIEQEFWYHVGEHKNRCTMMRTTSDQAASHAAKMDFGRCRYDMVFIDAGHDYENALADIKAWWPLVREGGYLCGHDYQHKFPGVMRAVSECFPLLRVAICPDSVWVVEKQADLRIAA